MAIHRDDFDGGLATQGKFSSSVGYRELALSISDAAARFLDPKTGLVRSELSEPRNCPACDQPGGERLFVKNGFPHLLCTRCDSIFVSPTLNEAALNDYYAQQSNSWSELVANPDFKRRQSLYHAYHLEHFERLAPLASKRLLDIGCNAGDFLATAQERGYLGRGLEFNRRAVALAQSRGLHVTDEAFSPEIFKDSKFGFVVLLGVLEHVPDPLQMLRNVSAVLEPGGIVALLVPNGAGLCTRILREHSTTFDGVEHLNFFNPRSLALLASQAGLRLAHTETTISELYTLNNFLSWDAPYAPHQQHDLILPTLTPDEIHKQLLGHHLLGYATHL